MSFAPSHIVPFLKDLGAEVVDDDCPAMSAAIAYYTVLSLPPLLAILVALAGAVFGAGTVEDAIAGQIRSSVGPGAAEEIRAIMQQSGDLLSGSVLAIVGGLAALLFGATGAFAQLQRSLNRAWEVEPDPEQGGLKNVLMKRVLSLGMVVTIAFFLLVSLVVSGAISAIGSIVEGYAPSGLVQLGLQVASFAVSLALITALFAAMFRVLPDAEVAWKDVWLGAFVTALLFTVGKTLIGIYLATSNPGSAFGAAGSLVLLLVWIQYSSLIVLVGAEFTQLWAARCGHGIEPDDSAVRVVEKEVHDRSHQGAAGDRRNAAADRHGAQEEVEEDREAARTGYPADHGEAPGAEQERPYEPGDHPWVKPRDPEPF
jgi:membrane protein